MFRLRCDSKMKKGMIEAMANTPIIPPVTRTPFRSSRLKTIQRNRIVPSQAMAAVQKKKYEKTRTANRVPANKEYAIRRSEEHTSELQSRSDLVCRLLLE